MGRKKKEKVETQPVSTKQKHVIFLLDETGSMNDCISDTIGGFNGFIDKQIAEKNDILFSLTLFNATKIEKRYVNTPIKDVEKLSSDNYNPNHNTPLWDAIGKTIHELKDLDETLFIILTDGKENESTEFTSSSIRELIKKKEQEGWQFLFLGADLKDFADAHSANLANISSYSKANTIKTFGAISRTVSDYYSTGKLTYAKKMDDDEDEK